MNYPIEILPNNKRKLISGNIQSFYLIRSTPTDVALDLIDENTGELKQKTICSPAENIVDLSTSLFGVFELKHNKIELTPDSKNELGAPCEPDCEVRIPSYNVDFYFCNKKGFWSIHIDKIYKQRVSYTFGDLPGKTFFAVCSIIHSPAKWNYWHFSINWFLEDYSCFLNEIQDDKLKKKISKRLSTPARALFAKFSSLSAPPLVEISKSRYEK